MKRSEELYKIMRCSALIQDLEELLATKVDVATDKGLLESIRDRILPEALPL